MNLLVNDFIISSPLKAPNVNQTVPCLSNCGDSRWTARLSNIPPYPSPTPYLVRTCTLHAHFPIFQYGGCL